MHGGSHGARAGRLGKVIGVSWKASPNLNFRTTDRIVMEMICKFYWNNKIGITPTDYAKRFLDCSGRGDGLQAFSSSTDRAY